MRIGIYSTSFYPSLGGTEKATWLLAGQAVRAGYEVTILTRTPADNWTNPEPRIRILRNPGWNRLAREYRKLDALVINGGLSARAFLPSVFSDVRVIPLHAMITDGMRGGTGLRDRLGDHIRSVMARQAHRHVGVSPLVLEAAGVEGEVIPNMIDPELLQYRSVLQEESQIYDLIYAGRLEQSKGIHRLLEVLAQLSEAGTDARLLICGDGGYKSTLREMAKSMGIEELVDFKLAGTAQELARAYARSKAVVHTPLAYEGFGMSLIEGMAFGLPSVINAMPALPWTQGGAGWQLEELTTDRLRPVIQSIQNRDEEYRAKSKKAAAKAEAFLPEQVFGQWQELFQTL